MTDLPTAERMDSPEAAVDRLIALHATAIEALRGALDRFIAGGAPPTREERAAFRYPVLRVVYRSDGPPPVVKRAFAKFQSPGVYETSITHPEHFRRYLLEQLRPLVADYGAVIEVGIGRQEIPYPYVLERGDELARDGMSSAELALHFPTPALAEVGDEVADGLWTVAPGDPWPLSLFDAVRVDYSLRRLVHYTGSDWRHVQPWILLTNYHRYVDQFVRWAVSQLA